MNPSKSFDPFPALNDLNTCELHFLRQDAQVTQFAQFVMPKEPASVIASAPSADTPLVRVRRQWNRPRKIATYRLSDTDDIRWRKFPITKNGGIRQKANRRYLHGYVMCDQLLEGKLAHSCQHGPGPHRIKVCITKKGNEKVWDEVLGRVVGDRARGQETGIG
jgi:hypothetical protein